jgi:hypothetical protein
VAANWLQNRVLHGNEEKRASRDSGLEGLTRTAAARWLRAQVNLSDKVRDPETNKEITRKWFCEKYPDKCQTTRKAPESYRQNFEDTPQGINQQIQQLNKDTSSLTRIPLRINTPQGRPTKLELKSPPSPPDVKAPSVTQK